MTPKEHRDHKWSVSRIKTVLEMLDRLPADYLTNEDIAVARARLTDWLDDHADRWTV